MGDHLIPAPEAFTLFSSPLLRVDGTKPEWQKYAMNVYYHHGEPHDLEAIEDAKLWCTVYGPTEQITRMRAELICRGVNKMQPPAREYQAIVGIFDHLKEKKDGPESE